jgi:hypothetical protein
MHEFHLYSGLQPNRNKSQVFFAGVDSVTKADLASFMVIPM